MPEEVVSVIPLILQNVRIDQMGGDQLSDVAPNLSGMDAELGRKCVLVWMAVPLFAAILGEPGIAELGSVAELFPSDEPIRQEAADEKLIRVDPFHRPLLEASRRADDKSIQPEVPPC